MNSSHSQRAPTCMCIFELSSIPTCLRSSVSSTVFPELRMQLITSSYVLHTCPFTAWIMSPTLISPFFPATPSGAT